MEVITHACQNCGAPLVFNPDDQKFHCDYCLSIFTEEEVTAFEKKQADAKFAGESAADSSAAQTVQPNDTPTQNLDLFLCPSCGAEIVTDKTTAATYCYFCHNPVVLSGRLTGTFKPEKVLPFAISKEKARADFLAWTKKKRFIPKNFFDDKQIQLLTGVYFPYWDVDAKVDGQFRANGTNLRVWRVGELEYTETKQYAIYRRGNLAFKNIVKNALTKNAQKNMVASVQPFAVDQAVDFHSQYLAGFQAEKRDIEYLDVKENVADDLKNYSSALLKDTANQYNTITAVDTKINITEENNHYVLLPLWLVTYQNKNDDTPYYFAMNGQSGKTAGVLPISYKKLIGTCAGIFAGLLALFLLGGYFI